MYKFFFKRVIDMLVAGILLILLSPLFIIVVLSLALLNRGKIFFSQARPGRGERIFNILKFKTMNDCRDENNELLPDSKRLTPVGRFVRKTSLDELPQLINVIIGDMSLIGPRPLLIRYLPYYNDEEQIRHTVRPGITGLAQVNGRNYLEWEERLKLDIYYVHNLSYKLDAIILFKTMMKVFSTKDILIDPSSDMLDFDEKRKLNIGRNSRVE